MKIDTIFERLEEPDTYYDDDDVLTIIERYDPDRYRAIMAIRDGIEEDEPDKPETPGPVLTKHDAWIIAISYLTIFVGLLAVNHNPIIGSILLFAGVYGRICFNKIVRFLFH